MHVTKAIQDAHTPVLIDEVIAALSPKDGDTYVDATYGRGGYASRILETARCTIYGIDQDQEARVSAQDLSTKHSNAFKFLEGNFGGLKALMGSVGVRTIQGAVFDLGVSSPQLDQAHRGFFFPKRWAS